MKESRFVRHVNHQTNGDLSRVVVSIRHAPGKGQLHATLDVALSGARFNPISVYCFAFILRRMDTK